MRYQDVISRDILVEAKLHQVTMMNGSDVRVWQNPMQSDLVKLSQQHDLRGVGDGTNVFVFDASLCTHSNMKFYLGQELGIGKFGHWTGQTYGERFGPDYKGPSSVRDKEIWEDSPDRNRGDFYVNHNNKKTKPGGWGKENWLRPSVHNFFIMPDGLTKIAITPLLYEAMMQNPSFARLVRNCEYVVNVKK
jgi:hypothetical protein